MNQPSDSSAELLQAWTEALQAFIGAFDTPVSRRQHSDEFSWDARKRLKGFDQKLREFLIKQAMERPEPVLTIPLPAEGISLVFSSPAGAYVPIPTPAMEPGSDLWQFFSRPAKITP